MSPVSPTPVAPTARGCLAGRVDHQVSESGWGGMRSGMKNLANDDSEVPILLGVVKQEPDKMVSLQSTFRDQDECRDDESVR
mmetsp:Transcript_36935/g.92634  ORF Transcript_36935/g.92634 Transcript_36935/m.92634 type:complete len:82 (-) Transcript_36935:1679-1924(-)